MPIKPENLARYPADWPEIRLRILQRARYQCEHPGCTARHNGAGWWELHAGVWTFFPLTRALREAGYQVGGHICVATDQKTWWHTARIIRVILTVAHLDHTPENCDDDNLRAWCQRHHLAYDRIHHLQTAWMTRRARANTLELFE